VDVLYIICKIINLYTLVLVARAITSFFPVTPGTPFAQVVEVLHKLTEPVLGPVRRVVPPLGMFDLSFLVVVIGIRVFQSLLGCSGGLL